MGMFDTVRFLTGAPRCPAGHAVAELQTKDFENALQTVYVHEGRVWLGQGTSDTLPPRLREGVLEIPRVERAVPLAHTGEVLVYGQCEACAPVLTFGEDAALHWDLVREHRAHLEWSLTLRDGAVVMSEPVRVETREDVRKQLLARGAEVLEDDDRLARRHFARRKERAVERA